MPQPLTIAIYKWCIQSIPLIACIHLTTGIMIFKRSSIASIVNFNHLMVITPPNDNTCHGKFTIYFLILFRISNYNWNYILGQEHHLQFVIILIKFLIYIINNCSYYTIYH